MPGIAPSFIVRLLPAFLLLTLAPAHAADAPPADSIVASQEARKLLVGKQYDEAAARFAELVKINPTAGEDWSNYGFALHSLKRYDEAIPAFTKAAELGSNPSTNYYNIACGYSLKGDRDQALTWLERSFKARYADQETLESDTDLDPLRADPRFAALTGITRGLAAAPASSREDGWRWDLDFLLRRMQQMHWSLFAKVPEAKFRAELEQLKADMPKLTDEQVRLRLRRIIALVGDGHTTVALAPVNTNSVKMLPLHLFRFADGLYIIGADSDRAALVGGRVEKIGALAADKALEAIQPYLSVDNTMGYLAQAPQMLLRPVALQEIGATTSADGVDLTVINAEESPRVVHVPAVDRAADRNPGFFVPGFTYLHTGLPGEKPLLLRNTDEILHIESDPAHKLVYFRFGAVMDTPQLSLAAATKQVFETMARDKADYLVIDMRFNGGGNTDLTPALIRGLIANPIVSQPGHLYVITGRHTFSAAQNVVNQINGHTKAIFVGEPTGSRPNFVGESTSFVLPHSKTRVYCSSRYWQYFSSLDERCWIPPDLTAPMTFVAYSHNQDPCVEAVLAHLPFVGQ